MKALRNCFMFLVLSIIIVAFSWQPTFAAWSTNPSENTVVSGGVYNQDDPQIVSDGAGGSIIAWRHVRSIAGTETDIFVQRLDAEGNELWIANGTAVCRATGNQTAPVLVGDGTGGAVITWLDYRSGSTEIYAQRVDSSGDKLWATDGVSICSSPTGNPWEPEIATDGAGGAIIAWMEGRTGSQWDIYAQRVDSSGSTLWTTDGVAVCTAADSQLGVVVVGDGAGGAILGWGDLRDGDFYDVYLQQVDPSGSMLWTANGISMGALSENELSPDLMGDSAGGVFVSWPDERSGEKDIYAQRVDGNGNQLWTVGGEPVCSASNEQTDPRLAGDGSGGAIVVWQDWRAGTNSDLYAQRVDMDGTALWATDGIAICTAAGDQYSHQLVSDGAGGAVIAWTDFQVGYSRDIYAQRIDTWGIVLWPDRGVVISMAANDQRDPALTADGDGGVFIVWDDIRSGTNYDVYAQHVDFNGRRAGAAWSHDPNENNPVCLPTTNQYSPKMVSDEDGGAIVAWWEARSGPRDIYAQRLDRMGSPLWTADAVPVCVTPFQSEYLNIVGDGAGGAIITWEEDSSGTGADIYVQRVDKFGVTQWTTNGIAVCSLADDQTRPSITSDGAGGAIIAWTDQRSGTGYDIYAQRVSASGTPLWTAGGLAVCTESADQWGSTLASDGAGGAIIAWIDDRLTAYTLYAQRLDSAGTALWSLDGRTVSSPVFNVNEYDLVSDGNGGIIAAWSEDLGGDTEIVTQRLDSSGNQEWGFDGVQLTEMTGPQDRPRLLAGDAGGAIITWLDARSMSQYEVYAQRISPAGILDWATNGVAITPAMGASGVEIVSDGADGAVISYRYSHSGGAPNIYNQRVSGTGSISWDVNGMPICTATDYQDSHQIILTTENKVIVSWGDQRSGESKIYAQQADLNGYLGDPEPTVSTVIDHPEDQGGVTVLSWEPSPHDEFLSQVVTHYSVWKRLPDDPDRAGWTLMNTVVATYQSEYGFDAATYEDYTGGPDFPLTEYKVIAHTSDPWVFWESGVRRGCSMDNLAPGAPLTLLGLPDESDVLLTWEASGDDDEDLAHYNVYRGTTPGFAVDENSLIGTVTDIEYTDPNPGYGTWYYRVAGEDVHGNVGTASNEAAVPLSTSTVAASLTCTPPAGVLPFVSQMRVELTNQYTGLTRRIAGRINVTLASGKYYPNWRAGSTNVQPGSTYVTSWNQPIPALAPLVGDNQFRLVAADVTPAPYNQPPYPPAGDTDSATVTVTGMAP